MQRSLHPTVIWFPLDNSAKLFPAIVSVKDSCVYRLAAELTRPVEPTALQQAVVDLKPRFPSMYVRLRRGLFWNYFEQNDELPLIAEESGHVNAFIDVVKNRRYHFRVLYYGCRVSLETFHGITDGTGAMELLKAILFRYLELLGEPVTADGMIRTLDQPPTPDETEDSCLRYYGKLRQERSQPEPAYRLTGTRYDTGDGLAVLHARMSASVVGALAKRYDVTLTQFLAALYIRAILETGADCADCGRTVQISVPVNLRRFFPSRTLRNFTMVFYASVPCSWKSRPFAELVEQVHACFLRELNEENLQHIFNANVAIEKNWLLRVCPLLVKNTAIRIGHRLLFGDRGTSSMSNLGVVELPPSMQPYVRDFTFALPVGARDTHNLGVVSYQDRLTITVARAFYETELERRFFGLLAEEGVELDVSGNRLEDRFRKEDADGTL